MIADILSICEGKKVNVIDLEMHEHASDILYVNEERSCLNVGSFWCTIADVYFVEVYNRGAIMVCVP